MIHYLFLVTYALAFSRKPCLRLLAALVFRLFVLFFETRLERSCDAFLILLYEFFENLVFLHSCHSPLYLRLVPIAEFDV